MNNKNKFINLFYKYLKNNNKAIPSNIKISNVGETKYFPPVSKEWKNSIYVFNKNNLKNLPIYDIYVNTLIKAFFNIKFNPKFIQKKKLYRFKSKSLNRVFTSKAEIKHTNSKAILTVYVYNREKISLLKKIKMLNKSFFKKVKLLINKNKKILGFNNAIYNKAIKVLLSNNLKVLRKYKLRLNLNKYKFEEKLIYILKNYIAKYYNKKVEFNIVNIKSVVFHSDFFTEILSRKFSKRIIKNPLHSMSVVLNKVFLPKSNRFIERSVVKNKFNYLENKYKYLNISYILNNCNNNLSELLNKLYYDMITNYYNNLNKKDYLKVYEIIFNSINYKNFGGIRIEAKGRLTKRYRADRSIFKVR